MKSGEKVTMGGATFIILKVVKVKEDLIQHNDVSEYIRKGEEYPVILENSVGENDTTYLIVNRNKSKQYFDSKIFYEVG